MLNEKGVEGKHPKGFDGSELNVGIGAVKEVDNEVNIVDHG